MASRKSSNLLPGVFQTDTNRKFLNATVDQLISEPNLKRINGYIGRKFAPTFKSGDSYIIEDSINRQNYQLEPSVLVRNEQGDITFFATYIDFLNKVRYYGGFIDNHSRLFENEQYTFDPGISFDKFVNFSQYYWLPNGPSAVEVNTSGVELVKDFKVTRNTDTGRYDFNDGALTNNTVLLARGGTYTFTVDQPGVQFWIQSELGLDGLLNATPTISSRDVLGVTNNGIDVGTIRFDVPQRDAQDRFVNMELVASVDYAAPLPYSGLHNNFLSVFLSNYPQYAGITGQLNGKTLVFVDQDQFTNQGESVWTAPNTVDANGNIVSTEGAGEVVPNELRFSVWQVLYIESGNEISQTFNITTVPNPDGPGAIYAVDGIEKPVLNLVRGGVYTFDQSSATNANHPIAFKDSTGTVYTEGVVSIGTPGQPGAQTVITVANNAPSNLRYYCTVHGNGMGNTISVTGISGNPIVKLVPVQSVELNQKVFIKYGLVNANREFYKDFDGFFKRMPLLSALQDELYFQDGTSNRLFGTFKIVDADNVVIDVENDILGQANYTSPNGVVFTSGLKVRFDSDVAPARYQEKEWYIENVGDAIRLVDPDWLVTPEPYNDELALNFPGQTFPEYITIKRDALDVNPWSRNNRWFHIDIITLTAAYNNTQPVFDQNARAQRPIVQFEGDYQLFNNGRIGKQPINILDTDTVDAFNQFEGYIVNDGTISYGDVFQPNAPQPVLYNGLQVGTTATVRIIDSTAWGGVPIVDGMRVLFASDRDPLVRDKIYVLNLVQYDADPVNGLPIGPFYIKLTIADDGDSEPWDTVVVTQGKYRGSQWWYDGNQWLESQQKIHSQQDPLFNIYDRTGTSLSEYTRSDFFGTKLFGYSRIATGTADTVLGFPLTYRNFGTQGDIEFKNYFNTDTFTYVEDQTVFANVNISELGFLNKIVDRYTVVPRNNWRQVVEPSRQYQAISYEFDGINNPFTLDITPSEQTTIPYIKVYKNNAFVERTRFTLDSTSLTLLDPLTIGDKIDVLVYNDREISTGGYYEIPNNLNLNAQNIDLDTVTLGQLRNHLVELSYNSTALNGNVLGSSNLRDVELKQQGGSILQHSATTPYASLFLLDETANFINALQLAQLEYSKFKNKFLELSTSLSGMDPTDPVASVDLILTSINAIKNRTFPWFYSDMVPYGTLLVATPYTIFNPLVRTYEISQVFNDRELSNRAVLVYLNDVQLVKGQDYFFNTDRPAVTINENITLEIDDVLRFVEYQDTDGNYIPETPTKLGMYPKFIPAIYQDDTYRNPITVIRGHDGSITPSFGDYRDDFLLELEKRIFNNIKVSSPELEQELYTVRPGKFRDADYSISELNQLISKSFQSWIGNNKIDFATNTTFLSNDAFTWNYTNSLDIIDGEILPGSWRACYLYFYDTVRPHQTPWEMLGFAIKPDWWEGYYGPAPYTGGNKLLWEDLEAGRIIDGERAGIDAKFARPGLTRIIPVDVNGYLRSPSALLTGAATSKNMASSWAVGQIGPTEWAWRTSSDYPFAQQRAMALAKPAKYFSLFVNTTRYEFNSQLGQYLNEKNQHITQDEIRYNGEVVDGTLIRSAGYINWIADYLVNQGINPSTKITPMLTNYQVNLSYKLAGFSDKRYVRVLAEQSSPTSTNDSIVIPDENYEVHLYKSTPVNKIVYSGVIVEKTPSGYTVRGYNVNDPFFTIIPSVVNSNAYKITVLAGEGVIYRNYQNLKLVVPYGYEFKTQQQVVDFLVSYERHLIAQGFVFNDVDEELGETRNFKLSVKEFLFWAQQGWKEGSILVLSPVINVLTAISSGAITDGITDSQYGSKVLDQNFKLVKNNNYNVLRTASNFKLTLTDAASVIGFVELNLIQYEHVLVFDNTTVFNDIIYKPELGNRQYRLKLVGQKTAEWDGSLYAPGFMYNSGVIAEWIAGKDYLKGELVQYKNQFFVALQNIIANNEFQFSLWKQIDKSEVKTGLLPNFSTTAVKSQSTYDSYGYFQDEQQLRYSHGLIGFKPRQYLDDLGLSETTQIELYKGFIKQKGSANAVNQLIGAEFNNISSDIGFFEEWAVRVGEYGAIEVNPYIEIALDEERFSVNPATARFVGDVDSNEGNGLTVFNSSQLYRSTNSYDGKIAIDRTDTSNYTNDIPTAGYVNIDDVDATIFDLANFSQLNSDLDLTEIGSGFTVWCANDFNGNWNVFRVTETNNQMVAVENSLNGFVTFTSKQPHGFVEGDIFLLRQFDFAFDGFYRVDTVVNLNSILVEFTGSPETYQNLTTFESQGILHRLDSLRFQFMEDARMYTPPHGWKEGEKIWIDLDAPTSLLQGQPFETGNNLWKVYEKTMPWKLKQDLAKGGSEYVANDGFGTSVRMSADTLLAVVGSPNSITSAGLTGSVVSFDKNKDDEFEQGFTIVPDAANTAAFGHTVDLAFETVGTGAPESLDNSGLVYVYNRPTGTTAFVRSQIIAGNVNTAGKFGSSIAFDELGLWLYVSAPDEDRVYVYGLNKNVSEFTDIISVNNENIIKLSGNIASIANVGDTLGQFLTGANVTILDIDGPNANVTVSSLTNIREGVDTANIGNISIIRSFNDSIISTEFTVDTIYTRSVTSSITLSSTPAVPNDAASLLVTSYNRTFIPNVDYTVSGNEITFSIDSGNIAQGEYVVKQKPYYAFVTSLDCPNGSGKEFGYALDASFDGAQLAVGTPNDTVNVGIFTSTVSGETVKRSIPIDTSTTTIPYKGNVATLTSYTVFEGAGSVYVYDRVIEAFNSTGESDYVTTGDIGLVRRVTIDEVEVPLDEYFIVGNNTVRFVTPPEVGKIVFVETNEFNLLEKLIGVDSLEGGLEAIQLDARFGTSLTICSNNCAIYVGAPNYDNGTVYNTGAVWKFHNKGRLYGINTGQEVNPSFEPGDTIRLDNFEVRVNLGLSGNVSVSEGDFITQPNTGANVRVLESTVGNYIKISDFANSNVFTIGTGNISINGVNAGVTPRLSTLDEFVGDINDANLLGISAVNLNGVLRIITDKTVAKNLLRILSGRNLTGNENGVSNVYDAAGLIVFAFMQIIVTPYNNSGEHFGDKVILAANAYMLVISSERGTTRNYTTFDSGITIFDDRSTGIFDAIYGSGSVYIYELYDDPRDAVEDPGRYAFAQQLNTGDLNPRDQFGYAIDIVGGYILATAPSDDTTVTDAGTVYLFTNPVNTRGWNLIRYQEPRVDIETVNRIYLYNRLTNTILTNMEFIDPAKGKILGIAEQEITYKTPYDPAFYNRGSVAARNISESLYWNTNQVGQVWWNLDQVRFIDYEQGSLTYRSINWGRLFPGSIVEVCEWVESTVLPSDYLAAGFDGEPKHPDNSAYVEIISADPVTNIITSKYYFWVVNKDSLPENNPSRRIPIRSIADIIENPKTQGLAYAAIIKNNAIVVYNVSQYLSAQNTILHLDYEFVTNDNIIHSEYELLQAGSADNFIPNKIVDKLIDSLAGIDRLGALVPDPKLSVADQYGIGVRPRQGMFVDRLTALSNLIDYVNGVLIQKPVARQYDLTQMSMSEPTPMSKEQSQELGEYDTVIETEVDLAYINTQQLATGYRVLVETDTTQDNLWVIYELQSDKTWAVARVQSYKTDLYWDYVDWYAEGFDSSEQIEFVVDTLVDALRLPAAPGDEILVRVANGVGGTDGKWNLITVLSNGDFRVVGIQDGTIQLKTALSDYENNFLGFGNQGFNSDRYDQNPNIEIRNIVNALKNNIFINELQGEFNRLFFVMINYLFNEQKFVDWIFKTSFISVKHQLRSLNQYPNYVKDNQTYYEEYINEVKPYATKVREYNINYDGNDEVEGSVLDFDLPPYYDQARDTFRSPSGELAQIDQQLWATGFIGDTLINPAYTYWYANRNHRITSILIENPGRGYTSTPIITIEGGGASVTSVATARAVIDFDTGKIIDIVLTSSGSGYSLTPTVVINGSSDEPAVAYAVLENNQIRTFDTALKFDRVSYSSLVKEWQSNTVYNATVFDETGKWTAGDVVTYATMDNGDTIRQAYSVNQNITTGTFFNPADYTLFNPANFTNANDRIVAYYQPTKDMLARDLRQLLKGIDYPGVQVQGLSFDQQPGMSGETLANITFSNAVSLTVGDVITQPEADILLNFNLPLTANVGQFITQTYFNNSNVEVTANATVYGSEITSGTPSGVSMSTTVYLTRNNNINFVAEANIKISGIEQVVSTWGNVYTDPETGITSNVAPYGWSNVGVYPIATTVSNETTTMVEIPDASIVVTKVWSLNKIQGRITSTSDFVISDTTGNIKVDNVWVNARPVEIEYVSSGAVPFDNMSFDNVEYDEDGIALLGADSIDTIIRSNYTDSSLGLRPEDINVDGGAYVDTYSSHAPEELVPGVTFDTLDMKVYTKITNGDVVGYRIFTNMLRETSFLRIADDYSTSLLSALSITDTEIYVTDATKLPAPSPSNGIPGVIFINGERITYYRNYATEDTPWQANLTYDADRILSYSGNVYISISSLSEDFDLSNVAQHTGNVQQLPSANILSQIRRGTQGTPMMVVHPAGTSVVDGSIEQTVPNTNFGNVNLAGNLEIASLNITSAGANYSQGITISAVALGNTITSATLTASVHAANGSISTASVVDGGEFTAIPEIVISKPANITATQSNLNTIVSSFTSEGNVLVVDFLVDVPIGTSVFTANIPTDAYVTSIDISTNTVTLSAGNTGVVSGNVTFYPSNGTVLVLDNTFGIFVGQAAQANNINADTYVTAINPTNNFVTLSSNITGLVSGNVLFYDAGVGGTLTASINELGTAVAATTTPSYNLRLTSAVDVAVGDIITQATTGVSATVVGTDISSDVVLINYNNTNRFAFANAAILLSGNIAASVGDYLTQPVSNANLRVVSATTGANVIAVYTSLYTLISGEGNIAINGVDTGEYPRTVGAITNALSNIAINGNYTSNVLAFNDAVYPLADALTGNITASGQAIVPNRTTVVTANSWYNLGASTAADGTGFEGATTEQVLFLKQATATNTVVASIQDLLTTEDTVNILITEDGQQILEE